MTQMPPIQMIWFSSDEFPNTIISNTGMRWDNIESYIYYLEFPHQVPIFTKRINLNLHEDSKPLLSEEEKKQIEKDFTSLVEEFSLEKFNKIRNNPLF